jgi:hypothetical protein
MPSLVNFSQSVNDLGRDTTSPRALGISLQLLIGPAIVRPAPEFIIRAVKSVEVTHTDSGRSGFQITLAIGRSNDDMSDYSIFNSQLLKPFTRVVILVRIGVVQRILIDGFVTNHQFSPSDSPGNSTLTVTGEDYSLLMDMHEIKILHPGQPDYIIVNKIILLYGLVPFVIPPPQLDFPLPTHNDPVQIGTDLNYLLELARKYNYVFYIEPTDIVGLNTAYWGPQFMGFSAQKAITFNMGPSTNAHSISVQNNSLQPTMVFGAVQDTMAQNISFPVIVPFPLPPYLASQPGHFANLPHVRNKLYQSHGSHTVLDAYVQALGEVDASKYAVTVSGQLDTLRYGDVLKARKLVSLRGVGQTHDGLYYVKSVTHKIEHGSYTQGFNLTREGTGSILSGV